MIAPHRIHGTDYALCVKHGKRVKVGEDCPLCPRAPMDAAVVASGTRRQKRDGSHAEDALYAALRIRWHELGGGDDLRFVEQIRTCWSRQYPWGAYLSPPRRFSADAGFPVARLLVEVEGQAHSIKARRNGDVVKSQLAAAAGFTLLRVLPEQVHNGEAVELIAKALTPAPVGGKEE